MKKIIIVLSAVFLFIDIISGQSVKVFILSGQSNAGGVGNGDQISADYYDQKGILLYDRNAPWKTIRPYKRKLEKFGIDSIAFGIELPFSVELKKMFPSDIIAIVKVAINGGTSIVAWEKNWNRAEWIEELKELGNESLAERHLYDELINQTKNSLMLLRKQYKDFQISLEGFLWLQNEHDCRTEKTVADYEKRAISLISNIRGDLEMPGLPFFLMDAHWTANEFTIPLRKVLKQIHEKTYGVTIVECEDLPTYEGLHFNTEGLLELGKRFANYYYTFKVSKSSLYESRK